MKPRPNLQCNAVDSGCYESEPSAEDIRVRIAPGLIAYLDNAVPAGVPTEELELPRGVQFAEHIGRYRVVCVYYPGSLGEGDYGKDEGFYVRADVLWTPPAERPV